MHLMFGTLNTNKKGEKNGSIKKISNIRYITVINTIHFFEFSLRLRGFFFTQHALHRTLHHGTPAVPSFLQEKCL